ncbi:carboxymuconolactone decarboxylase family protein [Streptomyces sp. SID2888]|uniref:carboxymuconolactone decarboxylase family protein n=1 Tax=Streptomyces sp. SID2888 TaxID=2690256 RepID=UPI00136CE4B9|nr:carboxymuconolactone decarboxylase family protein [Streptomyces sp. SID2888]MYV44186.1 carboxymuconolactone decarboxylase family protein [Streptomyces sp. SID2888]
MTPRLPKAELPAELQENLIKQFGVVPENLEVMWNSPRAARAVQEFAGEVGAWDAVGATLKSFAHMAVAAQVGCSWCLDIGYFQARNQNLDLTKASQVPCWRESEVFTSLERDVMGYAESMTNTPPTITDAQYASLLDRLGPVAMAELTAYIAFVNLATRANVATGVRSQGFSDVCEIPLAARPDRSGAASTA